MSSSQTEALTLVMERPARTPQLFRAEILVGGQPTVLRGIARDWPLVIAARQDPHEAMSMLEASANATLTNVLRADPALEGRFHYAGDDDYSMNFIRGQGNVAGILAGLREQESSYRPFSIAAQAMDAERYFPGLAQTHPMPLVPPGAMPRLWIGNAAKVATHNDPIENVAVVAAGRRRFTLFPPSAEPDLYLGPRHPTPAGARISMVHVTAPDLERYPRFASALEVAQVAELAPGDAIFIPRDWFHHVEALDRFNLLVNYWWDASKDGA
jgi:Cupin-like domain